MKNITTIPLSHLKKQQLQKKNADLKDRRKDQGEIYVSQASMMKGQWSDRSRGKAMSETRKGWALGTKGK